jgi:hypothetical protein
MCCSSAVVGLLRLSKFVRIGSSLKPIGEQHHFQLHLISNGGKIITWCMPSYGDGHSECMVVLC